MSDAAGRQKNNTQDTDRSFPQPSLHGDPTADSTSSREGARLANLEEVDTGIVLSCERCQSRWEETDPVALAGLRSGYGVLCPGCRSVVMPQRQVVPHLRLLDALTG